MERRLPKDLAADRARIKRGKVLGRRRSLELTQTIDNLVLPNITTTQLTQNCETTGLSCKKAREEMNGKERSPAHQIAKRGRLRDSTFMLEDNGESRVKDLEGLLVSKLNFQSESTDKFRETLGCAKKQRKQRSRLSKTDSGFCEDSGDDIVTAHSLPDSPNGSDKASNISNSSAVALDRTRKITLDFKAILNQDKTVVRNTEKLAARANMCVQSHQSLHADLVAFKNLSTHHKSALSNCCLQTNEHYVKLREVVLKTGRNSYDEGVKQSDTSLAVLKTRRRLLGKRNTTCPPFPFTQRRNKERIVDMSRVTCNCKQRMQFVDVERLESRQCVSCPVDVRASQTGRASRDIPGNDIPATDLDCAVSTSGLPEKALFDASRSQETVDVNVKCQEWLNRWIAFNSAPVRDNSIAPLESLIESS